MSSSVCWGLKTFCIITGASKGLGREIGLQVASKVGNSSVFILLARNSDGLSETKKLMLGVNPNISIFTKPVDFESVAAEQFVEIIADGMAKNDCKASQFQHALLMHNAGSLGDVSKLTGEIEDNNELLKYYQTNVFSMTLLTSKFLKCFKENTLCRKTIVNITSLCAIVPVGGLSLYCSGKAAREAFMRNLAAEDSSLRVVSYSPGPLDTEMFHCIQNNGVPDVRLQFQQMKALTCEESTKKLVKLLEDDAFKSGERYDYYDL